MSHLKHLPAMPCDFFESRFRLKGEDDLELRFKASSSSAVGKVVRPSIAGSLLLKERLKDALLY